jgi:hypothetical protein
MARAVKMSKRPKRPAPRKLDLRREWKHLYAPRAGTVGLVEVPRLTFLMIDGRIEKGSAPGISPAFTEAVGAMYSAAYTLKFMIKLREKDPVDYPVMALEGLWWVENGVFDIMVKDNYVYTLMIMVPDLVTPKMVADAATQAAEKKPNPALSRVRLEKLTEGLCVQAMHVGPYDTEPATMEKMRLFAEENGCTMAGKHHEIYLGDPRRARPEKLHTVLRHHVARAG